MRRSRIDRRKQKRGKLTISNTQPNNRNSPLHTQQNTPIPRLTQLRLIHRNSRTIEAIPHARNNPSHKQLRQRRRRTQNDSPKNHRRAPCQNHVLPPEPLAEEEREETAGRAADVVDRCDDPLHLGVGVVEVE